MVKRKKLAVTMLCLGAAIALNGCAGMGGGPIGAAVGHMAFGAVIALVCVWIYHKLKK